MKKSSPSPNSTRDRRPSPGGGAGLAAISLRPGADGVAYVARLLQKALQDRQRAQLETLELVRGSPGQIRTRDEAGFAWELFKRNLSGVPAWWCFNHLGIARAQMKVPRRIRRPFSIFLHGIEAWDPTLGASRMAAMRSARLLIANSVHTARRVAAEHHSIPTIHACPLGLLPSEATPGQSPDVAILHRLAPKYVLIVGRMSASERYKGHDQLIECWSDVLNAVPGSQLVLVGGGDDAQRLAGKAMRAGVSTAVLFTGFVSDITLQQILRGAAVLAMPSKAEGFGLVYLEAMRMGVPCIGSTADAAGEIIIDGETGALVCPSDVSGLARSIIELLTSSETGKRMGAAGRERFRREFTYERFCDRLFPILDAAFTPLDAAGA